MQPRRGGPRRAIRRRGEGKLSRREEQKAATGLALREASLAVIREHGLAGATIARITEAAGVSAGAFYVHFPSREALIDELVARNNEAMAAVLTQVLDEPDVLTLGDLLMRLVAAYADFWAAHRYLADLYADHVARGAGRPELLMEGTTPAGARVVEGLLAFLPLGPDESGEALLRGVIWLARGSVITMNHDDPAARAREEKTLVRMIASILDDLLPGFAGLPVMLVREAAAQARGDDLPSA